MSELMVRVWLAVVGRIERAELGQSTTEYALVMLAAAAVAGLVLAWATKTHAVSRLFDSIIGKVLPG